MAVLGPLDRRNLRKRCLACARRKTKCEGGSPCLYCVKKKQQCVPQAAVPTSAAVFVNACAIPLAGTQTSHQVVFQKVPAGYFLSPRLSPNVPPEKSAIFAGHFFTRFLAANDFGGTLDLDTLVSQFQSVPTLYHASVAIGALHFRNNLPQLHVGRQAARVRALNAYRTSITSIQNDITNVEAKQTNSSLWTTFFWGLFELMYDETGEGFVSHFLLGTSKILQLRGPDTLRYGTGRSIFLTIRVFEICRSLIYSEPTFLCQPAWRQLTRQLADESVAWHPIEAFIWSALQTDSSSSITISSEIIEELAIEGLLLRSALNNWHNSNQQWTAGALSPSQNGQSTLGTLYFHGISIFLSGIFDYRSEINHLLAPRLPQIQIQHHVDSILLETELALRTTNLGGVLFFFPLRVAGARVTSREGADAIVAMLEEISRRSFVVAGAFITDLKALWLARGI